MALPRQKQKFSLIRLTLGVTIDRSYFLDDEKREKMKNVASFLQSFLLTSDHLSDEEVLRGKTFFSMIFLVGQDDGILIPITRFRNSERAMKKANSNDEPILESVIDLGEDYILSNLSALRRKWLQDEPDLYRNESSAPTVTFKHPAVGSGRLYVDLVPTLFGRWRKRRFWFLKACSWREKNLWAIKVQRPVGAFRTQLRYLWRCLKPMRTV